MKKIDKNLQTRAASLISDSVDTEARTADFVISSEKPDSYDTVFRADTWDLDLYKNNPVVFYQHNSHSSDPDMLIGTSEVRQDGKETIATLTFESKEDNKLADKLFRKVSAGTLRGASISARVDGGRYGDPEKGEDPEIFYFDRQTLVEWSLVTIPSNPDARVRNRSALTELQKEVKRKDPKPGQNGETVDTSKTMTLTAARLQINKNK